MKALGITQQQLYTLRYYSSFSKLENIPFANISPVAAELPIPLQQDLSSSPFIPYKRKKVQNLIRVVIL